MVRLGNYIFTRGLGQDLYGWKIMNGVSRLLYIYQMAGPVWKGNIEWLHHVNPNLSKDWSRYCMDGIKWLY